MSKLSEIFRRISKPIPEEYDNIASFDVARYSDNNSDNNSDNKAIELQLTESIRVKQSKLDKINNDYEKRRNSINDHYDEKLQQMQVLYNQLATAPIGVSNLMLANIVNIMAGFKELREKELAVLDMDKFTQITETEEETKKLTQSIYHDTILDSLLSKLDNPSSDLELGLALGILLHHDPNYSNDKNTGIDSKVLLKQYFQKELVEAATNSQRIFEEHLISHARSVLLSVLSRKATPFGSPNHDYVIEPKPGSNMIKLTDTDIHHSFTFNHA